MASPPNPATGPTPQQIAAMQQQVAVEAQKRGITPQEFQAQQRKALEEEARKAGLPFNEYINRIKQQAWENHQRQQQMAQHQQANGQIAQGQPQVRSGQGQQVPIQPGAPDPKALAVAKWLRGQDLKTRTCILNGQRKDMFKSTSTLSSFVRQKPLTRVFSGQSNAPYALFFPPPTSQHRKRTLSFLHHPQRNKRQENSSSSFLSVSSPYECQRLILMKVMITPSPKNG